MAKFLLMLCVLVVYQPQSYDDVMLVLAHFMSIDLLDSPKGRQLTSVMYVNKLMFISKIANTPSQC